MKPIVKVMAFPYSDKLFKNPDAEAQEAHRISHEEFMSDSRMARGWYFHGQLECDLGYDLGVITNKDELPVQGLRIHYSDGTSKIAQYIPDGIYPVQVHGVETPCIGYFWPLVYESKSIPSLNSVELRGLICYVNDDEANAYARQQYAQKINLLMKMNACFLNLPAWNIEAHTGYKPCTTFW